VDESMFHVSVQLKHLFFQSGIN